MVHKYICSKNSHTHEKKGRKDEIKIEGGKGGRKGGREKRRKEVRREGGIKGCK